MIVVLQSNPGLKELVQNLIGIPFGLITVVLCGAELFNGNVAFMTAAVRHFKSPKECQEYRNLYAHQSSHDGRNKIQAASDVSLSVPCCMVKTIHSTLQRLQERMTPSIMCTTCHTSGDCVVCPHPVSLNIHPFKHPTYLFNRVMSDSLTTAGDQNLLVCVSSIMHKIRQVATSN